MLRRSPSSLCGCKVTKKIRNHQTNPISADTIEMHNVGTHGSCIRSTARSKNNTSNNNLQAQNQCTQRTKFIQSSGIAKRSAPPEYPATTNNQKKQPPQKNKQMPANTKSQLTIMASWLL